MHDIQAFIFQIISKSANIVRTITSRLLLGDYYLNSRPKHKWSLTNTYIGFNVVLEVNIGVCVFLRYDTTIM